MIVSVLVGFYAIRVCIYLSLLLFPFGMRTANCAVSVMTFGCTIWIQTYPTIAKIKKIAAAKAKTIVRSIQQLY